MQFDNFFIDYKLRLKTISERIIWSKLPLYRKISLIAMILLFFSYARSFNIPKQ